MTKAIERLIADNPGELAEVCQVLLDAVNMVATGKDKSGYKVDLFEDIAKEALAKAEQIAGVK